MIHNFVHTFKAQGRQSSSCFVKILSDDGEHMILFEDINSGMSVTNASEQLATEITEELQLNPDDCRFFETYQQYEYDTFDEVTYKWKDGKAYDASWKPAPDEIKKTFLRKK